MLREKSNYFENENRYQRVVNAILHYFKGTFMQDLDHLGADSELTDVNKLTYRSFTL